MLLIIAEIAFIVYMVALKAVCAVDSSRGRHLLCKVRKAEVNVYTLIRFSIFGLHATDTKSSPVEKTASERYLMK